ncbi:MAG: ATP-dependent helicase, partial [Actinomycetota bacterium]|nr:ATP-dependent helicase [Actinomycetota bacterium]
MPKFWVSPSQVARFYFHECDRYLRYRSASKEQRALDDIPKFEVDRSLLTRAVLEGGSAWEERLLDRHLAGRVLVADGNGARPDRRHSADRTLELLATAGPGQVIYQPTLVAPKTFYDRYGIDAALVSFTDCHPDLVMVEEGDDGIELRVVDAKASEMMKLSHRIQVGLYSILLEHVVAEL